MNKCPKCGVGLRDSLTHCPLCGKFIEIKKEEGGLCTVSYPIVDERRLWRAHILYNIWIAVFVIAVLAAIVNLFTLRDLRNIRGYWCLYAVAGSIYFFVVVIYPLENKIFYWREVFLNVLFTLLLLLFIDWFADPSMRISWSVIYIYPIMLAAMSVIMAIYLSFSKRDPGNSLLGIMIAVIFSGLTLLFSWLFRAEIADYNILPPFICFLVSLGIFIFFTLFKFKTFINTIKKRFHI